MTKLDPARQLLALEFVGRIEREKTIQSWGAPDRIALARLLTEPAELANAERFTGQVSGECPAVQAAIYLAAARMLADATSPEAVDARRAYLREACSFGLPESCHGLASLGEGVDPAGFDKHVKSRHWSRRAGIRPDVSVVVDQPDERSPGM